MSETKEMRIDSPIWHIDEIAHYLGCSKQAAMRHAKSQGFPTPIGNESRNRKWFREEVIEYFKSSRQTRATVATLIQPQGIAHSQIQYKPRRTKSA